jgi:hypothetical protein
MVFYRRDGKTYGEETIGDRSGRTSELIEKAAKDGRRFDEKYPFDPQVTREFDEHWLVDQSDRLQSRNKNGTYSIGKKFP